jgi:hypothetical protein
MNYPTSFFVVDLLQDSLQRTVYVFSNNDSDSCVHELMFSCLWFETCIHVTGV